MNNSNRSNPENAPMAMPSAPTGKPTGPQYTPGDNPAILPFGQQPFVGTPAPNLRPGVVPSMPGETPMMPVIPPAIPGPGAVTPIPGPVLAAEQPPYTSMNIMYTPGYLRTQIGKTVRVEFLIGTNGLSDRVGTLVGVGTSYILLREIQSDDIILCDIYSIKFVTFYL